MTYLLMQQHSNSKNHEEQERLRQRQERHQYCKELGLRIPLLLGPLFALVTLLSRPLFLQDLRAFLRAVARLGLLPAISAWRSSSRRR